LRTILVFPPKASPTYLPLGIASLVPYVQSHLPNCSIQAVDTNIEAWRWLAGRDSRGHALLGFVQGLVGSFYDRHAYASHRQTWKGLNSKLSQFMREAERYVATGTAGDVLMTFLDFQVEKVLLSDPELIGFSAVFLDQVPFALALARRIREVNRRGFQPVRDRDGTPRIVFGGAAMSALRTDELLAACPYVDGIVVGEGEAGVAALCSGQPLDQVPGLVFRSGAAIKQNPNSVTLSLKSLPPPDFSIFEYHKYFNPVPVIPVLFSRGCAWRKCRFCVHNTSFAGYRAKTVDGFVSQLRDYQERYGACHFYFADQYVGAAELEAIADQILDAGLEIHFHVMARALEDWTLERAEKLFRAGCRWVCWGVESGSQRLLDLMNKGTNACSIQRVLGNAATARISNLVMMIFGLPTSTDLDLIQTFRFLEDVYDSVEAMATSSFVLWRRSHFGQNPGKYGMHITGAGLLLQADGRVVHSHRLDYSEVSADGSLHPPRGPVELAAWEDRRKWLGGASLLERLPCEHYLLYVSHQRKCGSKPVLPPCKPA
jgi:anaerobic magnesium-protoporphyrin IX monomethyl ester cyclase